MTFTSNFFLIGLLPWFICLFLLFGNQNKIIKIALIALANSVFYIGGGVGAFIFICGYSILIWAFCLVLRKFHGRKVLAFIIIISIAPLLFAKYTGFVIESLNSCFNCRVPIPGIVVPIGISFFTFEAVSLLVDTYKNTILKKPDFIDVYLYLTFFPTVTSGPIIRMNEFRHGLAEGSNPTNYTESIERIVIGLSKKVLIADKIAILADYYFDGIAAGNTYSCIGLWIGSIAYTLQLYYDFSGYSDMAIGIGQLLGFTIKENFNKPYHASSISDFWKRWHISLTQWFRDYIYIPLGGNRCTIPRHLLNMLIVWFLTGIWHGADWSFIVWGIGYFILLVFERYISFIKKITVGAVGHIYTLFFINLLWIPFRAKDLRITAKYIIQMFGRGTGLIEEKAIAFIPFFVLAVSLCFPWDKLLNGFFYMRWFIFFKRLMIVALAGLAICAVVNSSYTPYIYGNF